MKLKFLIYLLVIFILSFPSRADSGGIQIIRDAEIETAIRNITNPIFVSAGLESKNVKIFIINDPQINAFVSDGMNIFINSGLITKSYEPSMLRAVIAHETGHIVGGHLIRKGKEYEKAMLGTVFSYVLGAATAVVSGSPGVGQAIISGGAQVAQRNALKYSRGQEEAADQAAIKFLHASGYSAEGLKEVLELLFGQETLVYDKVNPYVLTHPLTRERISSVNSRIGEQEKSKKFLSDQDAKFFSRAVVKLKAFLEPSEEILREFKESDKSVDARYARAIAYYKIPNIKKSIAEMDSLIKDFPKDPYIRELKGQILFENGKVEESINEYEMANKLLPSSALIKLGLASSLLAMDNKNLVNKAIDNLTKARVIEPKNSMVWRQLAIAHGKNGDLSMSHYALAEEAIIVGKREDAKKFAELARKELKNNPTVLIRINDILRDVENSDKNKD